jgi:hypothetical protein
LKSLQFFSKYKEAIRGMRMKVYKKESEWRLKRENRIRKDHKRRKRGNRRR